MEIKKLLKKKFYSSKEAIFLDSIDLSKIVVSNKWKINDTIYKYYCGYLDNDVIQPLCVILPQMSRYIKYFDNDVKNMSFVTDDKEAIDIDSVLKTDKKAFPQAYLEQCKYKLKKRKPVNFIDFQIIDDDSDDDDNDNENDDNDNDDNENDFITSR